MAKQILGLVQAVIVAHIVLDIMQDLERLIAAP
jgi:hypothetical protein